MINYQQPFLIQPNRVWRTYQGGAILDQMEGAATPADSHFPEDWIGSATRAVNPGREHLADEGIGQAQGIDGRIHSMTDLYTTSPEDALGLNHVLAHGVLPQLLVKLLDSAMRLHIQAHPSVAWSQTHLNANSGKTEAWWILQTRADSSAADSSAAGDPVDDAYVYMGFQHPPTPAEWKRIVDAQDLDAMNACFEKISVSAGDVLLVEGGIPHAIGPGITMVKIQEPTDYVVRCEYAHGGLELPESARTMGLGLDRVLDLFDYTEYPADVVKTRFGPQPNSLAKSAFGEELALLAAPQTERIEARRIHTSGPFALTDDERFSILIVLEGTGILRAAGHEVALKPWSRLFLPAALDGVELDGALTVARCLPPTP